MKSVILIEAYTMSAYRAIRPAIVGAHIGYVGVCGLTFSATIYQKDYASSMSSTSQRKALASNATSTT